MLNNYEWNKFVLRINIKSSIQEIYDAITKAESLESWYLYKASFATTDDNLRDPQSNMQKEDSYTWQWCGISKDFIQKGTILEANGQDEVRFTFTGETIVTIIIKVEEGENIVELWQENIPTTDAAKIEYHLNCIKSWTFYLANLKSLLEGGVDLRNKNENIRNLVNG